jgi:hypothetical protein
MLNGARLKAERAIQAKNDFLAVSFLALDFSSPSFALYSGIEFCKSGTVAKSVCIMIQCRNLVLGWEAKKTLQAKNDFLAVSLLYPSF